MSRDVRQYLYRCSTMLRHEEIDTLRCDQRDMSNITQRSFWKRKKYLLCYTAHKTAPDY